MCVYFIMPRKFNPESKGHHRILDLPKGFYTKHKARGTPKFSAELPTNKEASELVKLVFNKNSRCDERARKHLLEYVHGMSNNSKYKIPSIQKIINYYSNK